MKNRYSSDNMSLIDDFLSNYDLLEAINAFCESERILAFIREEQNLLISLMKTIEEEAPDYVKIVSVALKSSFEQRVKSFEAEVIAKFKIRFYTGSQPVLDLANEHELLKKELVEIMKENLPKAGPDDIRDISKDMVNQITRSFANALYDQVPFKDISPTALLIFSR